MRAEDAIRAAPAPATGRITRADDLIPGPCGIGFATPAAAPPAGPGRKLRLPRRVRTEEAFRLVIGEAVGLLLGNAPAARAGDAEGVHQTRVALRRLRAALALFAPLLEPQAVAPVAAELQRLGRVFGAARDWDVFCLHTLPRAMDELPPDGSLHRLAEAADPQREAAHRRVAEEVDGRAPSGIVLELVGWAEGVLPDRLADGCGGKALGKLAPRLMDRLAAKVAKRGRRIGRRSGAELHALRKSLKKLRYAAEDLAGLYQAERAKTYARACKRLLDTLGAINDAAVTRRLLDEIGREGQAELGPGLVRLADWNDTRREQARRRLGKAWRALRAADSFWH